MSRTYGHVEVHDGRVVAVWFRCQPLPFQQSDRGKARATDMDRLYESAQAVRLLAVEVEDDDYTPPTVAPSRQGAVYAKVTGRSKRRWLPWRS